jgi:flagellar basal body-associated protein FliL
VPSEKNAKGGSGAGIIFSVLAVVLAVLGGWFWSSRRAEPAPGAAAQVRSTLHLETFVLNLADPAQRSYLRVGIDLGLGREIGKNESAPVAEVRDTILGVLSETRVDDLLMAKGKAKLKQDLLRALQQRVPELVVEDVYFTEFLIQR